MIMDNHTFFEKKKHHLQHDIPFQAVPNLFSGWFVPFILSNSYHVILCLDYTQELQVNSKCSRDFLKELYSLTSPKRKDLCGD